jgi:murein DD-endopeptidase MepM/ murein hydrolase activator NlpD
MKELSDFVKKQAGELKKKEKLKNNRLLNLNKEKAEKQKLLEKQNEEIARLELAKKKKEKIKRKLQGKESKLKAKLRAKRRESAKLKAKIENVIGNETKPRKNSGKKTTYSLSPEERKLSNLFVANKGKLPWPLKNGVVAETFGVHKHPVLKHVKTKNNGIDFATSSDENARAVFKGKVVSIVHITNTNIAVIIKHGEYFTVYSNLDEVFVHKNQIVNEKQIIGKIHTNLQGKTVLHFEVWRGKTVQNPAYWLLKR